jgi:hypothetical protein
MYRLVPGLIALALLSLPACKRERGGPSEPGAEPATSYDSPTPSPQEVCIHLAEMIAIELGGVDPQIQAETIATCTQDMTNEQQVRGSEGWDAVARCVMAAQNEADIDRCDQLYPASNAASPNAPTGKEDEVCVIMVSVIAVELMAEAEAAGQPPPELSDDEVRAAHAECLRSLETARQSRTGTDYDRLLGCLANSESTVAMDQCLTQ